MSLPPGFLDELRNRTSLAQVAGRKVVWDLRKSNQNKGDMWAPCPFHQEKTPSFHVDDRQGFYYCFGCHAKGDAISFVRETENVGFMEAVEILAREAGMEMPAPDPGARERADRRTVLAEIMERAVQFYRLQLKTAAAAAARDYLAGRGLDQPALDRFEIGFAPDDRQRLFRHLTEAGIEASLVVAAGLAAEPDDGGAPYDRFRDRIIFPIRDARGRAIALGGRAMSPNARAKYLNSPETELFDKGRSLYNHGPAREAVGKGQPLIVAEGYMDVIALVRAGFAATVAPLGTAITEDQLRLMWRMHAEPIVALDGDAAGLRAAMRLIDLALPMLEAGRTLRFVLLPDGQDPDDLVRGGGAPAMQRLLDDSLPLVQLLWRRETEGKIFDSPERRAALDKALRTALVKIPDASVRRHYGAEINRLRQTLFGGGARKGPGTFRSARGGRTRGPAVSQSARGSILAAAAGGVDDWLRESVILALLIANPEILPDFEAELESLHMAAPDLESIRVALLDCIDADPSELRARVEAAVGPAPLEKLFSAGHVRIVPAVMRPGDREIAALSLAQELAKLEARRGAEREIAEAMIDIAEQADEGLTWRLGQAAEARNRAERSHTEDRDAYEAGENGALIRKDEKSAFEALVEQIDYHKGRQRH